jgi:hypothetical protein
VAALIDKSHFYHLVVQVGGLCEVADQVPGCKAVAYVCHRLANRRLNLLAYIEFISFSLPAKARGFHSA